MLIVQLRNATVCPDKLVRMVSGWTTRKKIGPTRQLENVSKDNESFTPSLKYSLGFHSSKTVLKVSSYFAPFVIPDAIFITTVGLRQRGSYKLEGMHICQNKFTNQFYRFKLNLFVRMAGQRLAQRNRRLLAVVYLSGSTEETNCSQGNLITVDPDYKIATYTTQ